MKFFIGILVVLMSLTVYARSIDGVYYGVYYGDVKDIECRVSIVSENGRTKVSISSDEAILEAEYSSNEVLAAMVKLEDKGEVTLYDGGESHSLKGSHYLTFKGSEACFESVHIKKYYLTLFGSPKNKVVSCYHIEC